MLTKEIRIVIGENDYFHVVKSKMKFWYRIIHKNHFWWFKISFWFYHSIGLILVAQLGASTENDKNSYNETPLRDDGIPAAESISTVGMTVIPT